jgi:tetratricopeptide (TPR) repeat protein
LTAHSLQPSKLRQGVIAAEEGRVAEGLALIRAVCAAEPLNAEAHAQLARWLSRLHRQLEAQSVAERALALRPCDARTFDTVGVVFSRSGRHEQAVDCFEQAAAREPAHAGFRFNLASSLKFLGRFDEAEAAYEACVRADPRHWSAHAALSQLRPQTPERNHLDRLRHLLTVGGLEVDAELQLRHAIAKELEDLGRYDDAMDHLAAGKARQRAATGYTFERDRVLFDAVTELFREPLPAVPDVRMASGNAPIFVVGLPRTGTTLVERILSSHSMVASAGESQNFGVLLKRATGTRAPTVLDRETLARSLGVDLAAVGREYVERTKPHSARPRFVDKLPLNFFYLGHIARALPEARLVVLRRHPLDSIVANYRQLFATTMRYYDYSLDLADLARYYVAFDRLIEHWHAVLPGRVHDVGYEALVHDQHAVTARLLDACGLAFEESCLAFERNPAPTSTASAVQVRLPLYQTSIDRWRRYEHRLAPAVHILGASGVDLA